MVAESITVRRVRERLGVYSPRTRNPLSPFTWAVVDGGTPEQGEAHRVCNNLSSSGRTSHQQYNKGGHREYEECCVENCDLLIEFG